MLTLAFSVSEWWGAKMYWLSNDLWVKHSIFFIYSNYCISRKYTVAVKIEDFFFLFPHGLGRISVLIWQRANVSPSYIFYFCFILFWETALSLFLIFIMAGWPMWIKISAAGEKCHAFQAKTNSCWCECLCTPLWLCTHSQGKLWLDLYD